MIFFKLFQQLLLPSSIIFLLFLAGLVFLLGLGRKKRKLGQGLLIVAFLTYCFLAAPIFSNVLISPLESKYAPLKPEELIGINKAVLLLGGREANILRGSEMLRLYHLKSGAMTVIISGTDPSLATSQEALAVKRFFVSRGINEKSIIIEGQSRNTWENVRNVREIVKDEPFLLITSAYHMERAVREFKKVGANAVPAPTDFKIKTGQDSFFAFLPNIQNLRNSDLAFREYLAIFWYNIK